MNVPKILAPAMELNVVTNGRRSAGRDGWIPKHTDPLSPDVMTVGFAPRFWFYSFAFGMNPLVEVGPMMREFDG